jgi:CHAD domain-containing protein
MPPAVQTIARFSVRTEADLLALRRILILRGGRIGPSVAGPLQSLQLDTREHWLRRAGLTLHILRDARRGWIVLESGHWTTGQAVRRIRACAPLPGPTPRFPGPLPPCRLSHWFTRMLPDSPVWTVRERLNLLRVSFPALELDGVQILVSADRPAPGRRRSRQTVELALESGTSADLARLCRRLEQIPGWTRMADLEPVPGAVFAGGGSVASTLSGQLRPAIQVQWDQIFAETPGARAGLDPERIHRMRLAVRRLRSLSRLLPPGQRMEEAGLKPLGAILGRIRDLDIGQGRLAPFAIREGPDPASDFFRARLELRRARAHLALVRFLDSGRFRNGATPAPGPWAGTPKGAEAPDAQARLERQIRSTLTALHRARLGKSLKAMHRLRIRGKQTRYILEALEPLLGEPARVAALALGELQRKLGEFQDEVTFQILLDSLARQPRLPPALARRAKDRAAEQAGRVRQRLRTLHKELGKTGRLARQLSGLLPRGTRPGA